MPVPTNYLAILLAAIVSQAVGMAWYSEFLFGKQWMKLMGWSKKEMKEIMEERDMKLVFGSQFVATLIQAFILSHLITFASSYFGDASLVRALTTAFWVWLGFVAVTDLSNMLYSHYKPKKFAIDAGNRLVSLLAMAALIHFLA